MARHGRPVRLWVGDLTDAQPVIVTRRPFACAVKRLLMVGSHRGVAGVEIVGQSRLVEVVGVEVKRSTVVVPVSVTGWHRLRLLRL